MICEDIDDVLVVYVYVVWLVVDVGFDVVEIYLGYNYLVSVFLFLLFNWCDDEFGGLL